MLTHGRRKKTKTTWYCKALAIKNGSIVIASLLPDFPKNAQIRFISEISTPHDVAILVLNVIECLNDVITIDTNVGQIKIYECDEFSVLTDGRVWK